MYPGFVESEKYPKKNNNGKEIIAEKDYTLSCNVNSDIILPHGPMWKNINKSSTISTKVKSDYVRFGVDNKTGKLTATNALRSTNQVTAKYVYNLVYKNEKTNITCYDHTSETAPYYGGVYRIND